MILNDFIVKPNKTILETMEIIDKDGYGIAFICDDTGVLLGVVTDGDVRRYILKNGNLANTIISIANKRPKIHRANDNRPSNELMAEYNVKALPLVDDDNKLLSIEFLNKKKIYKKNDLHVPVVIMAGGKGTRLLPYTNVLPKPLIPIGEKTITELILEQFMEFGCSDFSMIVNYKKELIKAYFHDLVNKEYSLNFIEEPEYWGTGGGLKLLEDHIKETFFMTNCDVIIKEDYAAIYHEHKKNKNLVTIVCAIKQVDIPYGTIELDAQGAIAQMKEKPSLSFITNTGLYLIEPEFLQEIPKNTFIHITDVIQQCLKKGKRIGVYPVSNNAWLDMGQPEELKKMYERLL